MIIDSRNSETSINVENIQKLEEDPSKKLLIIAYQLPEIGIGGKKMVSKEDKFECVENKLILKTYEGIQREIAQ